MSEELVDALKRAAVRKTTAEEIAGQRVSFVYGQLPSSSKLTKDDVRVILKEFQVPAQ